MERVWTWAEFRGMELILSAKLEEEEDYLKQPRTVHIDHE